MFDGSDDDTSEDDNTAQIELIPVTEPSCISSNGRQCNINITTVEFTCTTLYTPSNVEMTINEEVVDHNTNGNTYKVSRKCSGKNLFAIRVKYPSTSESVELITSVDVIGIGHCSRMTVTPEIDVNGVISLKSKSTIKCSCLFHDAAPYRQTPDKTMDVSPSRVLPTKPRATTWAQQRTSTLLNATRVPFTTSTQTEATAKEPEKLSIVLRLRTK